jgi:ribosomal protein S18 acetylase RimI-like enzyme
LLPAGATDFASSFPTYHDPVPPDFFLRLKFGSTAWNRWRQDNPDLAIVLDSAVLDGMILTGVNFSGVSLRRASLHATNLMNADLRGADFTDASLVEADLIGAKLHGTILTGANLREADLLGADPVNARCSLDDLRGALHVSYPFVIRVATPADANAIAAAHIDSIESIGPQFYSADVVRAWRAAIQPGLYLAAMGSGEVFFVAAADPGGSQNSSGEVLGFSSHHVDDGQHSVGVYVRGIAARRGIGSALLRMAESSANAAGAASLRLDSSLAAVDFYKANGFVETGRGEHRLRSGAAMACVFMHKNLSGVGIQ